MTILDIFKEFNIPFALGGEHHHVREDWIGCDCPYCSPGSGKFRMGYKLSYHYFSCWICGRRSLYQVFTDLLGVSSRQAYDFVKDLRGERPYQHVGDQKPQGRYIPPRGLVPLMTQHCRYLRQRRLEPQTTGQKWGLMGLGIAGRLSWRIFIPIQYRGQNVSWTTRSISEAVEHRYITAEPSKESICHKDLLFGEDNCRHAIVIHEGPLDVLTTGPGAVGTLGVNFSRAQFLKMLKYPVRAVCFDNQPDAQRRARQLRDQLSGHPGETYNIVLESGKDTNSADPAEVQLIRERFLY